MKRTNKYLSLALAIIMALSLCVTSFAANDGVITLSNPVEDQTYTLYKIFDATIANSGANASYTIDSTNPWYQAAVDSNLFDFELASGTVYYVTLKSDETAGAAIATWAQNAINNKMVDGTEKAYGITTNIVPITYNVNVEEGETAVTEVKWTALPYGYYFVDSSLGSLCSINTTTPNATVLDKNAYPSISKQVQEDSNSAWGSEATADYHQDVNFKLTVNTGSVTNVDGDDDTLTGIDKDFEIIDTLPPAMTFKGNTVVVKAGETTWTKDADYTVDYANNVATIKLLSTGKLASLAPQTNVVITYAATVNSNVATATAHTNTAKLVYGTFETTPVSADVYTFGFSLKKVDNAGNQLEKAEFKLYTEATGGTEIPVVKNEDGTYRLAMANETGVAIVAGNVTVNGLDAGTYYLEEIKAPEGYNILAERKPITVGAEVAEAFTNGSVEVINKAGGILPGTGGVGTTMFYVLGSVMMIGAAILLVTKKKMANEQ